MRRIRRRTSRLEVPASPVPSGSIHAYIFIHIASVSFTCVHCVQIVRIVFFFVGLIQSLNEEQLFRLCFEVGRVLVLDEIGLFN